MKDNNRQKLELLAPAGSFEALKAAVLNGADSVYLGGQKFNARANAGNFTGDELCRALDYAHERGVKVYITLNTLLKNSEMEDALAFSEFIYEQGADAVIIQDQGLLGLIRKTLPDLAIHASTQMTVTNASSIHTLEKLGVKRIILSRELSLEEIESISAECRAELEIFVHGAICVCYSGQCLMSSFIGGRSGNRGVCAQPCRLPWSLSGNGEDYGGASYLISPRDLMAIDFLPRIKKAGIVSLKLEGRMKSPEYVAIVTSIYKKYLNLLESIGEQDYRVSDADREKLMQAFSRGGFTQSYLKGDRDFQNLVYTAHPKNQGILIGTVVGSRPLYSRIKLEKSLHMGDGLEIIDEDKGPQSMIVTDIMPNGAHVRSAGAGTVPWVGDIKALVKNGSKVYRTLSKPLFDEARQTYERGEAALVPVDMAFTLKMEEPARLRVADEDGNKVEAQSELPAEKALNKALSTERIKEQLQKTGDTPYWLRHLDIDTDGASTIPVSALNALRRTALEEMKHQRTKSHKRPLPDNRNAYLQVKPKNGGDPVQSGGPGNNPALSAYFYTVPDHLSVFDGLIPRIYLPVAPRRKLEELRLEFSGEVFLWTPPVLKGPELVRIQEALNDASDLFEGLACGNLGALAVFQRSFPEKAFCADYSMNLFNSGALELQKDLGAETGVLSPELRLNEVQSLGFSALAPEAIVYGRIPLMTMEYCPSSAELRCSGQCAACAGRKGYLKDRMGEVFPFRRDPAFRRTQIFNAMPILMDDLSVLRKTGLRFLRLVFTDEDADACRRITRYFYNRLTGVREDPEDKRFIQEMKDRGFTKGHWFRGV